MHLHFRRRLLPSPSLLLVIASFIVVSDLFSSSFSAQGVPTGPFNGVSAFAFLPPSTRPRISTSSTPTQLAHKSVHARKSSFPTITFSPSHLSRHAASTTTISSSSSSSSSIPSPDLPLAPGPRSLPLFGNMLRLIRLGGPDRYDAQMKERYGKVARSVILGRVWYTISDPDLAREILVTRTDDFQDSYVPAQMLAVWGDTGIIFSNGEEHFRNRRLTAPAFHRPELVDRTCVLVVGLAEKLRNRYLALEPGTEINVSETMRSLTLEAITQSSFSISLGLFDDAPPSPPSFPPSPPPSFPPSPIDGRRLDKLVRGTFLHLGPATRNLIPHGEKFGLNRSFSKFKRIWRELNGLMGELIEKRRQERRGGWGDGRARESTDLLDIYLEASGENVAEGAMSNTQITKNVFDVFFAGSDTTATTISGALFEIVKRPEVLDKILMELESVDVRNPAHFTPSSLASALPSLEAAIRETLRFYPLLASLSRVATRDTTLGGFSIKEGSVVAPSVLNLHMDERIWGQDVKVFRPSRWTEKGGSLETRLPKGSYTPFGMGPRVCLGMRLALAESMVVLAMLLKTVKFSVKEGRALDIRYPGAATFKGGVKVVVEGLRE